ncbi:MAG: hypothetical protein ACI9VR_000411 [Cognaticolwellia sp.]|jgi:hypothetical protein
MKRRLLVMGWVMLVLAVLCLRPWKGMEDAGSGERQVFYALDPGGEISFRVGADETHMRILVRLETPDPGTLDEATTWRFGVGMELEGGGQTHNRAHWTRSRLTLLPDGTPAAVTPTADRIVTDTRIVDLELAPHMSSGGLLRIRPVDLEPGERLLVRSFRETTRTRAEMAGGDPTSVKERLARTYPLPWPELSAEERLWFSTRKRLTLPAEELIGGDTVALTRYASPSATPTSESWGYKLNPGESTAVNVRGPAVLRVWAAEERDKRDPLPSNLPIELTDASPEALEGGSLAPHRVDVPPGAVWSLHWHRGWSDAPVYLSFELEPEQGLSWGEPPGAGGAQPLAPERRRLTLWRVDKAQDPIVVPVAASQALGVLRVEARPLSDTEWKKHPERPLGPTVTVSWEAVDAQGEVLESGSWEVPFEHASYERFVEQEDEPVAEPVARYLYHPQDAVSVRFGADAAVDLRFSAPLDVRPLRAPEYGLSSGWRGRYAPWERAAYLAVGPTNSLELTLAERQVRMDATVRIEPREESGASDAEGSLSSLRTYSVRPLGRPAQHPILEPVHRNGPFQVFHRTRLGLTTELEVPESGVVQVDFRVATAQVGLAFSLTCGDVVVERTLVSSAGILTLLGLPSGTQSCSMRAPEGFFLADVPGRGARWARRTLYRVDGRTLRVRAPVNDSLEVLYARSYTPPDQGAPLIDLVIDGGELERQSGVTERRTPAKRSFVPQEVRGQGRLVSGGSLQSWSGMQVVFGDDVARGVHVLEFTISSANGPVYMRFDGSWRSAQIQLNEHWVRVQETP